MIETLSRQRPTTRPLIVLLACGGFVGAVFAASFGYRAFEAALNPAVAIAIAGGLFVLALGLSRMSSWALKSSAAICGAANFFALFYLIPFEPALLPPLSSRLGTVAAMTVVTTLMVGNYFLSQRAR